MTAEAGLVPCAETGIRQTFLRPSPRDACQARITSNPVNSPWEPALGCSDTAARPVIPVSQRSRSRISSWYPVAWSGGAKGCRSASSGHDNGTISAVAFNFIVHEPSGIMEWASERSRASRRRRNRSISCSV